MKRKKVQKAFDPPAIPPSLSKMPFLLESQLAPGKGKAWDSFPFSHPCRTGKAGQPFKRGFLLTRPIHLEYTSHRSDGKDKPSIQSGGRTDMTVTHVAGENKGKVMLYALSTCVWCKKAKQLLDQLGVGYDYVEIDLLPGEERTEATNEVKKLNPRCSFPTLSINDQCIVGYDEQKVRESLGL
jgi:glutaredoxin